MILALGQTGMHTLFSCIWPVRPAPLSTLTLQRTAPTPAKILVLSSLVERERELKPGMRVRPSWKILIRTADFIIRKPAAYWQAGPRGLFKLSTEGRLLKTGSHAGGREGGREGRMGEGAWPGFLGILWGGADCSRIKSSGLLNLTWSLCPLHSRYQSSTSGLGSSPLHVWAWKGPFHIKLKGSLVSSVLAWRIRGTGEPGGLPSVGSHRVQHN